MGCSSPNCLAISGSVNQVVDADVVGPWVRFQLSGSGLSPITVGNKSNPPNNSAVITSFQWGASNGNGCVIEIVDEEGGDFDTFFKSFWINPQDVKSKYVLQVTWGWVTSSCQGGSQTYQTTKPHILFLKNIEVKYASFLTFILEGIDLLGGGIEYINIQEHYGTDDQPMKLQDAITKLCHDCGLTVQWKAWNTDHTSEDNWPGFKDDKPLSWKTDCKNPLSIIRNWVDGRRSKNDKGVYIASTDTTSEPTVQIWEDGMPKCSEKPIMNSQKSLGVYIVNGGPCSPVIEFSPKIRLIPTLVTQAGGGAGNTGVAKLNQVKNLEAKSDCPMPMNLQNNKTAPVGAREFTIVNDQHNAVYGAKNAASEVHNSTVLNLRANSPFVSAPIEADLTIQGNPKLDDYLYLRSCAPVSIIVLAPYRLAGSNCPTWQQTGLAGSNCIPQLSNSNWLVKGVSHQIKAGSYTTTLRVFLATPGVHLPVGNPVGNMPNAPTIQ